MRKLMLLAGVAALAASMPALADAQERGRGGGKGQAAEAQQKGGGKNRAERARGGERQARGNERRGREARAERQGQREARAEARGRGNGRSEQRLDRDQRRAEQAIRGERQQIRDARRDARAERTVRVEARDDRREARRDDRRDWRGWTERRMIARDRSGDDFTLRGERGRALAVGPQGCPPGLARQNAFCMPPGQLRKARLIGQRLPLARLSYNVPERYRYRFSDDSRYFYRWSDDRSVYRFDRSSGLVSAVFPVVSSGLFLGEPLPLGYDVYNVPFAYRSSYPDTRDAFYRYDDGAIYRVDSGSRLVDGIVALLTGGSGGLGGLGVGDRLPAGYDVYNVPFDYRDTYFDTDRSMYRYADGSVYRVDPTTRLIEAVLSLLV